MVVSLVVACGDGAEMFEFIEETLDSIALLVEQGAEGRRIDTVRHGADISPGPAFGEPLAKAVGIVSPIRQENVSRLHGVEHILGAPTVVGLACGVLQGDG